MKKHYIFLVYDREEFKHAKYAVISVEKELDTIREYKEIAKLKLCEKFGYNVDDTHISDWGYIGTNFEFID